MLALLYSNESSLLIFFLFEFQNFPYFGLGKKGKKRRLFQDRPVAILSRNGPFVIFFFCETLFVTMTTEHPEMNYTNKLHFILFAYDKNQQIFSDPNLFHLSSCLKKFLGLSVFI